LRILCVNKFHYLKGGADRCYLESAQLLQSRGHEVVFFSMLHERNRETPYARYFVDNVDFFGEGRRNLPAVALRVLYSLEARRKIASLIEDTAPQIAHLHNIAHQLSPSILHPVKKAGLPVIQTVHDFKFACPTYGFFSGGEVCERCRGRRYYHAVMRRCNRGSLAASLLNCVEMYLHQLIRIYDNVDLFITPSAFVRDKMMEYGFSSDRVVHIPNFVVADEYVPAYSHDDYCVFFGRLEPYKGIATLLQAMKQVGGSQLYILGEGRMRAELEAYAREHDIQNVAFVGHKSGEELKSIVRNSMFSVVPSECYENLPYAVLESFALGTPVVAANIGGIPEMVEPGVNGLLFEPGNVGDLVEKMQHLLKNKHLLADMGRRGRAKVEREYGADTHYERLMQVYGQLL
jgi:glycosyltransferase involved in cell wall biosynthesis